jgi:Ca2+:H+ antiporter
MLTARSDRKRREAHQAAWYDDPSDEVSNLPFPLKNPFGKRRPPKRLSDLERSQTGNGSALRPVKTDNDFRSTTIENRRAEFGFPDSSSHHGAMSNPDAHLRIDENGAENLNIQRADSPSIQAPNKDTKVDGDVKSSIDGNAVLDNGVRRDNPINQEGTHERKTGLRAKLGGMFHEKEEKDDKDHKPKLDFTVMGQLRATIFNSWINVLFIASPVGIGLYYAHINPVAVFVVNFIAIVPLAGMLSFATEEIALRTGDTLGGLLNASFGNAVELIVSIIALVHGQVLIVQTSLIGSILSNLLLVLGMCFFFGGFNRVKQSFNVTVAQTASSLLFLAVSSLILPTAFAFASSSGTGSEGIAQISRATAICLLFVYACYIFFQLKTHADMYNKPSEKNPVKPQGTKTKRAKARITQTLRRGSKSPELLKDPPGSSDKDPVRDDSEDRPGSAEQRNGSQKDVTEKVVEEEVPQLHIWVAVLTLAWSTALVALNAEYLVDSINAITCSGNGISKTFVGLILLPIVGNAAEHATAVTVAVKDKMDLAIGVAVGSSMQIALLVLPFTVVLGWIIGNDKTSHMTLLFDGFQIAVLFVAVLLVNYLIQDGESHWLEGVLLQVLYLIIAVAAWCVQPVQARYAPLTPSQVLSHQARTRRLPRLIVRLSILFLQSCSEFCSSLLVCCYTCGKLALLCITAGGVERSSWLGSGGHNNMVTGMSEGYFLSGNPPKTHGPLGRGRDRFRSPLSRGKDKTQLRFYLFLVLRLSESLRI